MKLLSSKCLALLTCIALAFAICAVPPVLGQRSMGREARAFEIGEELVYEAEFTRAVLRKLDIADFHFTAIRVTPRDTIGGSSSSLRLTGDVATKGFFSKLFNLRIHQHIESSVDPIAFSVVRTNKLDEQGKRVRVSEAVFDRRVGRITWTERDPNHPQQEPRVATAAFAGAVQDIVSAIYFVRAQPLEVGKGFEVQVSDSGRVYGLPVTVVERRRMKTVLGNIGVIRLDPEIFGENRLVRGNGKFSIWLSDDERRIPVRARLSNSTGTFEIKLKRVAAIPVPH